MSATENQPIPLKELLIEATFAPNRALRPEVKTIDLGVLGQEAEKLYDRGEQEFEEIEFGQMAIVTSDRRLLLLKEDIVGERRQVHMKLGFKITVLEVSDTFPKRFRQNRFMAVAIHNHPLEMPPSTFDLNNLFLSDKSPLAHTAVLVASPTKKTLIFRGLDTPQWSEEEIELNRLMWDLDSQTRFEQFYTDNMTVIETTALSSRVQNIVLNHIALEHDLRVFICPLRQNIASLATF